MTKVGKSSKYLWPALGQGLAWGTAVLAVSWIYLVISGGLQEYYEMLLHYPFKILFIAGMFLSIVSQTAVENWLDDRDLHVKMNGFSRKFIHTWSNPLLALVALSSILFIENFWFHCLSLILYFAILSIADLIVFRAASAQLSDQADCVDAKISKMVAKSVGTKIDGASLISIGTMMAAALWLTSPLEEIGATAQQSLVETSQSSVVNDLKNPMAEATHPANTGEDLDNPDPAAANGDSVEESPYPLTAPYGRSKTPDLLMSGAIGLHLLFSFWLLVCLMLDWGHKLNGTLTRSSKATPQTTITGHQPDPGPAPS